MKSFINDSERFLELVDKLVNIKGYKKKEIAKELGLAFPAFSGLCNTVLPEVAKLRVRIVGMDDGKAVNKAVNIAENKAVNLEVPAEITDNEVYLKVREAFGLVNNLSMSKITASVSVMNGKMEEMMSGSRKEYAKGDIFSVLRKQAEQSYPYIAENIQGLWKCFYYSSNKEMVKGEPFLIRADKMNKTMEVYKGNRTNSISYYGTAYLSGSHTLTVSMAERGLRVEESLLMYFSIPLVNEINMMRGTFLSLSYARQPIARRVVLKRVSDDCDFDAFDSIQSAYSFSGEDRKIAEYLCSQGGIIRNIQIFNPSFDEDDLEKETDLLRQYY